MNANNQTRTEITTIKSNAVKDRLIEYGARYKQCLLLMREHKSMIPSGTSNISAMPKRQTDTYEPEVWASKREFLWLYIRRVIKELADEKEALINIINRLPNEKQRKILFMHYMEMQSVSEMSKVMKNDRVHISRLKRAAIEMLDSVKY